MTVQFNWGLENTEAAAEELDDWENGFLILKAKRISGFEFASTLIAILMEADRMVAAAKARAAISGGEPQEAVDALMAQINALVPGVSGPPLGSLQADADRYGVGPMYAYAQSYCLLLFRNVQPYRGNLLRDTMLVDRWGDFRPKQLAGAQLGLALPGLLVFGVGAVAIIATAWLSSKMYETAKRSELMVKTLEANQAQALYIAVQHNKQAAALGQPFRKPGDVPQLKAGVDAVGSQNRAPWVALGAAGALLVGQVMSRRRQRPAPRALPSPVYVERVANPARRKARRGATSTSATATSSPRKRKGNGGPRGNPKAKAKPRATRKRKPKAYGGEADVIGRAKAKARAMRKGKTRGGYGGEVREMTRKDAYGQRQETEAHAARQIWVMEGPRGGRRFAVKIPRDFAAPQIRYNNNYNKDVWLYQVGDWRGSGRTAYFNTLKNLKGAHPGEWRRVNPVVYLSKRELAQMIRFIGLGANAAERASIDAKDAPTQRALSALADEARGAREKLRRKVKQNPRGNPERELGQIGDVNPLDYGGGRIFLGPDGPYLEYTQGLDDDQEEETATLVVYRVDLAPDALADLDWATPEDIAGYTGQTVGDLRKAGRSKSPVTRATVYEDVAGYYGWENIDSYPLSLSYQELEQRWFPDPKPNPRSKRNPPARKKQSKSKTWTGPGVAARYSRTNQAWIVTSYNPAWSEAVARRAPVLAIIEDEEFQRIASGDQSLDYYVQNPAAKKRKPTARRCKKCAAGNCTVHGKRASYGHDTRPAKYKGLARSAFAYPDRWMYPLNTKKRTQAAARFFGQYCDRYPAAMRKTIAANIDKAERKYKIGKQSPK